MIPLILIVILGLIMVVAAVMAVYTRNLLTAIIASGVISLMASILFLFLASPDVAMTEAAVGSGLTTTIFLLAAKRMKENGKELLDRENENG